MDSTPAADARAAKRARPTPSAGDDDADIISGFDGGGLDLISGLDDDVLLRVLGMVADVRDVVRTGALSRRWLRLWTRAPALHFASRPESVAAAGAERRAALELYAAFVDDVLARRTRSGCAIESLSIVYTTTGSDQGNQPMPAFANAGMFTCPPMRETECSMQRLMPACVDAAQGWIRDAFRYGVKSFNLDLRLPPNFWGEDGDHGVLLHGLPNPVMLETMRLALGDARLRLPSTVKFASLTDLSLERIRIAAGGAHLLGRLVSSAICPRLQKLQMRKISFHNVYDYEEMRLEADVLSELWIEDVEMLRLLKLKTPSLRVFHIYMCSDEMLSISAPRLEELAISFLLCPPRWLEVNNGDLSCVRSLKICLWSHCSCVSCHRDIENQISILLLKKCSSLTCLDVTLRGDQEAFEEDVDMIKSRVPQLPHITSLTVNVSNSFERHGYGAGLASLLTRFCNLRHLSLHLPLFPSLDCDQSEGSDLLCDHPDGWESNEISMAYLQELELTGFTGTDCELWFIKAVLTSAKRVCKVAISFNKEHQDRMDAFERMLLAGGMRTSYRYKHRLTCIR